MNSGRLFAFSRPRQLSWLVLAVALAAGGMRLAAQPAPAPTGPAVEFTLLPPPEPTAMEDDETASEPGTESSPPAEERPPSPTPAENAPAATAPAVEEIVFAGYPRPVVSVLEAQIELARRLVSSGSIDGRPGTQTAAALRAFQESADLDVSGRLDDATRAALVLSSPPFAQVTVTDEDLARLQPLSPTWLGKSQQAALEFETVLELLAERSHAHPDLLRKLNPDIAWDAVTAGTRLIVPSIGRVKPRTKAVAVHVRLAEHVLEAHDAEGGLLAHFPVSIAANVEKRPMGELHVTVVIPNPDYTFDPAVFTDSDEARTLGRKLILPPGPNNPVGVAWIGLDRPGCGIHGTPNPEHVGRTESHGCLRLANWDARAMLDLAWAGLPVHVEP